MAVSCAVALVSLGDSVLSSYVVGYSSSMRRDQHELTFAPQLVYFLLAAYRRIQFRSSEMLRVSLSRSAPFTIFSFQIAVRILNVFSQSLTLVHTLY